MIRQVSLLLIAAAIVAGCARPAATPTPVAPATSVGVAPAQQTDVRQALAYTGDVKASSEVSVIPKQSGRILSLAVDVGSQVKAGDPIAQIEHVNQDLALQQAKAQLLGAQAKVDTIKAGPRDENVKQAQIGVDTAKSRLQTVLNGPRAEAVAQAQLQVDQAQQRLDSIKNGSRQEAIDQAQANLNTAQARLTALKNGPRPEVVAQLQLAVSQAKNSLFAAQTARDGTCGNKFNPGYLCQSGNAQVDAAQTGVDQAVQALKTQTAPPTATDLQQAQAAVDQAQAALDLAKKPYTAQDLKTAQDALNQAQQALALAQKPYTAEDVRQAQDAVSVAEQQLALAEKPYTDQDLESAQAGVAQAQAGVDQAQQGVNDTQVTAPISGVITQKLLDVGALASTAQPIVSIAASGLKITISAADDQVASLKIGSDASVTGSALGIVVVPAKITNISPSGDTKNRTFAVDLVPDNTVTSLRPGMFVQVTLNAVDHKGVIAVPNQAILERTGKNYVFVVNNNIAKLVPVTVGISDGKVTEVTGVDAGAAVVVQGQDQISDGDHVTVVKQ
jgi:RND family efflux transporter MFP subunit